MAKLIHSTDFNRNSFSPENLQWNTQLFCGTWQSCRLFLHNVTRFIFPTHLLSQTLFPGSLFPASHILQYHLSLPIKKKKKCTEDAAACSTSHSDYVIVLVPSSSCPVSWEVSSTFSEECHLPVSAHQIWNEAPLGFALLWWKRFLMNTTETKQYHCFPPSPFVNNSLAQRAAEWCVMIRLRVNCDNWPRRLTAIVSFLCRPLSCCQNRIE